MYSSGDEMNNEKMQRKLVSLLLFLVTRFLNVGLVLHAMCLQYRSEISGLRTRKMRAQLLCKPVRTHAFAHI